MTLNERALGLRKIFPRYSTAGWYTQAKRCLVLARQNISQVGKAQHVFYARAMIRAGRQMQNERSLS